MSPSSEAAPDFVGIREREREEWGEAGSWSPVLSEVRHVGACRDGQPREGLRRRPAGECRRPLRRDARSAGVEEEGNPVRGGARRMPQRVPLCVPRSL